VYVVEMNHGGQIRQLMTIEYPDKGSSMISLSHNDGLPLSARWITESLIAKENN
jgi:2-oxoglutarate ferredoxin oxidoreductase subunit alpha